MNILWLISLGLYSAAITSAAPNQVRDENSVLSIKLLIQMRKYSKNRVYRKFGFTYSKFDVCGLRYYQKRRICLDFYSRKEYKLKLDSEKEEVYYPNLSCVRILIDVEEVLQTTDYKDVSIFAYKCPNPYRMEPTYVENRTSKVKFFVPIRFYVAGGVYPNSAIINYQHLSKRSLRPIQPLLVFFGINVENLRKLYHDQTAEPYRRSPKFYLKPFVEQDVRRTEAAQYPLFRYPHLAEDAVKENDEIKKMTPYQKFQKTYNKMNICAMTTEDKLTLCRQVFETVLYKLLVNENENLRCSKQRAILYSDKKQFTLKISSIVCISRRRVSENSYLLTSYYGKTGLIAFMEIHPFPNMLPDAVLSSVTTLLLKKNPKYLLDQDKFLKNKTV